VSAAQYVFGARYNVWAVLAMMCPENILRCGIVCLAASSLRSGPYNNNVVQHSQGQSSDSASSGLLVLKNSHFCGLRYRIFSRQ
jgi:hypothetical protein